MISYIYMFVCILCVFFYIFTVILFFVAVLGLFLFLFFFGGEGCRLNILRRIDFQQAQLPETYLEIDLQDVKNLLGVRQGSH